MYVTIFWINKVYHGIIELYEFLVPLSHALFSMHPRKTLVSLLNFSKLVSILLKIKMLFLAKYFINFWFYCY